MKKFLLLAICCVVWLSLGNQCRAELIAYWNQNNNALPVSGFGFQADPNDFPQAADAGVGQALLSVGGGITSETTTNTNGVLVYTWIESFAGTAVNALNADPSGGSIAIEGGTLVDGVPSNNGAYIQFQFNMTGYQDLVISYATRGTNSGFQSQEWSWSTDGTNFTPFQTISGITTTFELKTLGAISNLNNVATAYIRVTLTGVTTATGNNRLDNIQFNADAISGGATTVVGSSVIHYGFTGVGSIFDSVKSLHKEGASTQALSFDNLINSSRGINGVSFSLQDNGAGVGDLSPNDFVFQMSPQGAFDQNANPASGWELAPAPTSLFLSGGPPKDIVTQVDIRWADNAIQNRWLRITILANANTGLAQPEVYYLGHLLGETIGPSDDGIYTVAFSDITPIRSQVGSVVDAGSIADIDKNSTVAFADISAMRPNVGTQLPNISVP